MGGIALFQLLHQSNQLLVIRKLHPEERFLLVADDIRGYGSQGPEVPQIYRNVWLYS